LTAIEPTIQPPNGAVVGSIARKGEEQRKSPPLDKIAVPAKDKEDPRGVGK
jgi:hypothetical protein